MFKTVHFLLSFLPQSQTSARFVLTTKIVSLGKLQGSYIFLSAIVGVVWSTSASAHDFSSSIQAVHNLSVGKTHLYSVHSARLLAHNSSIAHEVPLFAVVQKFMKTRDNFVATPTAERSLNPQNLVGNVDGNELLIQTRQGGSVLDDPNVLNVLIHTTTLRGIVETFLGSGQKIIWGDEKMVRRRALSSFPPIIYINPTIKDPEHVVQLIAHELGHETSGFPIATLFPKLGPQVHPQDLPTLISTTVHDGYISEGGASTLEEITAQELREQGMRSFTPFGNVDWTTKIPVLEAIETPEEFRLFLHSLSAERAARHDNFLTLNTNMLEQTVRKQFVDHFKKRK